MWHSRVGAVALLALTATLVGRTAAWQPSSAPRRPSDGFDQHSGLAPPGGLHPTVSTLALDQPPPDGLTSPGLCLRTDEHGLARRGWFGKLTVAAAALGLAPSNSWADVEFVLDLPAGDGWKVAKKLDSVVRIKAMPVLQASIPELGIEAKITKLPLGQAAVASLSPANQLALAEFFEGGTLAGAPTNKFTVTEVEDVMKGSLKRQAAAKQSTLREVLDVPAAAVQEDSALRTALVEKGDGVKQPRKLYVRYSYESETCKKIDIDGLCEPTKPERRRHFAEVTVALETQARTLAERQRMDSDEMEKRQIDVLWLCSVSAPVSKWPDARDAAFKAVSSFSVFSD